MALDTFECKICVEDYDSQNHKPRSLDCGHTFCELCIQNLLHGNNRTCPTCRRLTNKSTDQLPVIFALIPSQESTTARSNLTDIVGDKCNDHGCVLDRFCADCGEMVCRKCVKNSHAAHGHEFMDDVLHMDPDAATLTRELENKIKANINSLSKSMSVPIEICKIIDELPKFKKGLKDWMDRLSSQKKLTEQHLKDWNDARNKCSKEKYQLFKKLCHQWKGVVLPPRPVVELTSLTKKIEELNKYASHLQGLMQNPEDTSEGKELSKETKRLLNGHAWRVESDEDSQAAISRVRAGKIPSYLAVVSSPTTPIQNLPEVLNFLGSACADGSISVKPLDTFWAPSSTTDSRSLKEFIEKFSRRVCEFYGSPHEVATLCQVNPRLDFVGVRLASMADINKCSTMSENLSTVCCLQSLPAAAGARMLQLGWRPSGWHFPDAKAGSVDWMISLMEPVLKDPHCRNDEDREERTIFEIVLPRCTLSKNDFSVLLKKFSKYYVGISCEHSTLPASVKSNLELMAKTNDGFVYIQWRIPFDDV